MTVIYSVPTGGDGSADLESGATVRYGIELNGASGKLVGKPISTFSASLKKTGTPTGNITATVRNSADTVRVTFQETLAISSVTTSFVLYTFTLASPITLANGDRILIEYAGTTKLTIELYTTDQFDAALTRRTRFTTAYATSNTTDIVGTITDGTFFGKSLTVKYNIATLAGKSLTLKYNIRVLAKASLTLKYNIRTLAGKSLSLLYNIRQLATKSLILKYNIRTLAGKSLILKYNIRTLAGKSLTLQYNIRQLAGKSLNLLYNIRTIASKPLTLAYNIRTKAGQSLILKYNIRGLAGKDLTLKYNIRKLASKSLTIKYNIRAIAKKSLTLVYNIRKTVGKSLTILYNIPPLNVTNADLAIIITRWLQDAWTENPYSTVEHYLIPPKSKITFGRRFDLTSGSHSDCHIHVRSVHEHPQFINTDATSEDNEDIVNIYVEVRFLPERPVFSSDSPSPPSRMMWHIRSYIDELIRSNPEQLNASGIDIISHVQQLPDSNTTPDVHGQSAIEQFYTIIFTVKAYYNIRVDRVV